MAEISFDFNRVIGAVKPMHGVGQPPLLGIDTQYFKYLSEAHIPYSRLHDVGGWFGGNMFVDIPNVFRDFDADVDDPASYDFVFTDLLLKALDEHHCKPIYRLGVTIENFHQIKSYRIFPPEDYDKWARICEHIIRHYNEGWANGFHYDIKYWEIWNEPDGHHIIAENGMWKGTPEQYYDLYRITSRHLRACFGSSIKIGGYASCGFTKILIDKDIQTKHLVPQPEHMDGLNRLQGFVDFFDGFLKLITEEKLPLDFFSYHSYCVTADRFTEIEQYVEKRLEDAGLGQTEIHLNEWATHPFKEVRGTALSCANSVAMMCAMQDTKMDIMCYYDARIGTSVYGGLFHPMTYEPLCAYYGFKAFGELYAMGTQAEASVSEGSGVYVTAAVGNGKKGALIANIGDDTQVKTNLNGCETMYLIDDDHFMEEVKLDPKEFMLKKNQVVLVVSDNQA